MDIQRTHVRHRQHPLRAVWTVVETGVTTPLGMAARVRRQRQLPGDR
jgi:hypothetical protein